MGNDLILIFCFILLYILGGGWIMWFDFKNDWSELGTPLTKQKRMIVRIKTFKIIAGPDMNPLFIKSKYIMTPIIFIKKRNQSWRKNGK